MLVKEIIIIIINLNNDNNNDDKVTRRGPRTGRSVSTGPTSPQRRSTWAGRGWGTTTCAGGGET